MYNMDQPGCRKFSAYGEYVFRKLERMEKPVIAAVNGFALGGDELLWPAISAWLQKPLYLGNPK